MATGLRKRGGQISKTIETVLEPAKHVDFFPKLKEDHKKAEKTTLGAVVTIVSFVVILLLFISELSSYFSVKNIERVMVDPTLGERLHIDLDITFHALHCGEVNLDSMSVTGEQQNGIVTDFSKTRLTKEGMPIGVGVKSSLESAKSKDPDYCGSCYGAESEEVKCCNSCTDLQHAYEAKGWNPAGLGGTEQCKDTNLGQDGEGCRIAGSLGVSKTNGNLHAAMGQTHSRDGRHIHQFNPSQIASWNGSHTIHKLHFGTSSFGTTDPLEGHVASAEEGSGVHQYFIQIVPMRKRTSSWFFKHWARSCQYSVTSAFRPAFDHGVRQNLLPGVFFIYQISPFMIELTTSNVKFFELVTNLFAIVGGVLTVAGMINSVLFHGSKVLSKSPLSPTAKLATN